VLRASDGRAVKDAQVYVAGDGVSAGAVTDAAGAFSTVGLPTGTYTVNASSGAGSSRIDGVRIAPDYGATLKLEVGVNAEQKSPRPFPFRPIRLHAHESGE
jgi:hypothetical protein